MRIYNRKEQMNLVTTIMRMITRTRTSKEWRGKERAAKTMSHNKNKSKID